MEWQPIETAPEDTGVLLYGNYHRSVSEKILVIGRYATGGYTEGWEDDRGNWFIPTHWMPLPAPPEGDK